MPISIRSFLTSITSELATFSASPQLDAEILLAYALKISREQLYIRGTTLLTEPEQTHCEELIKRRKLGEPIAYIIGEREFWSLPLCVSNDVLIPRPETELLVELVLSLFSPQEKITLADLGTGSGAIAIAITKERPHWLITATDKMPAALQTAQENATRLEISNISFILSDWCEALPQKKYDVIISNPPYLRSGDEHLSENGLWFEPREALVSGDDGLVDLTKIISQAKKFLRDGGWLLLEHGYDQSAQVKKILQQESYKNIEKYRDFSNNDRVSAAQFFFSSR